MRQPAAETIVVKENAIRLVRRADSTRWQVHYKVDKLGVDSRKERNDLPTVPKTPTSANP